MIQLVFIIFSHSGLEGGSLRQILNTTGVTVFVSQIVDEFSLELEGRLFGFLLKFGFFGVVKVVDNSLVMINFAGKFISCCAIFLVF